MTQRTAAGPYQKSVRVLVTGVHPSIEYQLDGQTRMVVNCVVADGTRAVRVAVFDQTKFPRFVEGSGVILRNFIIKPETCTLTITSKSQVFPSAPVAVDASTMEEARRLFSPPPAEVTTIEKALASPVKTKVSIRGQIVKVSIFFLFSIWTVKFDPHQDCSIFTWRWILKIYCSYVYVHSLTAAELEQGRCLFKKCTVLVDCLCISLHRTNVV